MTLKYGKFLDRTNLITLAFESMDISPAAGRKRRQMETQRDSKYEKDSMTDTDLKMNKTKGVM